MKVGQRKLGQVVYFAHMAHDLSHKGSQNNLPEGMYVACDGLELL